MSSAALAALPRYALPCASFPRKKAGVGDAPGSSLYSLRLVIAGLADHKITTAELLAAAMSSMSAVSYTRNTTPSGSRSSLGVGRLLTFATVDQQGGAATLSELVARLL